MDPEACLIRILEKILELDSADPEMAKEVRAEAVDSLYDLAEWFETGGFVPSLASADWNWPRK